MWSSIANIGGGYWKFGILEVEYLQLQETKMVLNIHFHLHSKVRLTALAIVDIKV